MWRLSPGTLFCPLSPVPSVLRAAGRVYLGSAWKNQAPDFFHNFASNMTHNYNLSQKQVVSLHNTNFTSQMCEYISFAWLLTPDWCIKIAIDSCLCVCVRGSLNYGYARRQWSHGQCIGDVIEGEGHASSCRRSALECLLNTG